MKRRNFVKLLGLAPASATSAVAALENHIKPEKPRVEIPQGQNSANEDYMVSDITLNIGAGQSFSAEQVEQLIHAINENEARNTAFINHSRLFGK